MTDSNQASTIEEDEAFKRLIVYQKGYIMNDTKIDLGEQSIDWQKEYQALFVKSDQYLTRAIQAEGDLNVAKMLLADQEIELRRAETRITSMCAVISCARNALKQATKELSNIEVPY